MTDWLEPFAVWSSYDDEDLLDYVAELTDVCRLNQYERDRLLERMCWEADRPHPEQRLSQQATNEGRHVKDAPYRLYHVGEGLSARTMLEHLPVGQEERRWEKSRRARLAREPYRALRHRQLSEIDGLLWRAGCVEIRTGEWLYGNGPPRPYEDPMWYAEQIGRAQDNTLEKIRRQDAEGAAYHAARAGELLAEMRLKVSHDAFFTKAQRTATAQRDSGASSTKVSAEERMAAWRRWRAGGQKATEAGRFAAEELGVSEKTVRNAFPGRRYPVE